MSSGRGRAVAVGCGHDVERTDVMAHGYLATVRVCVCGVGVCGWVRGVCGAVDLKRVRLLYPDT